MNDWRPHIWKRYGNWHCCLRGAEWPRGVGDSQFAAWENWLHRLIVERKS